MSPPSVQHTCSQLIKEGLKLTLQSKRKLSSSDSRDEMDDFHAKRAKTEEVSVIVLLEKLTNSKDYKKVIIAENSYYLLLLTTNDSLSTKWTL